MKGKMGRKNVWGPTLLSFQAWRACKGEGGDPVLPSPPHRAAIDLRRLREADPGGHRHSAPVHSLPPHCSHGPCDLCPDESQTPGEKSLGTPACGVRGDSGLMTSPPPLGKAAWSLPTCGPQDGQKLSWRRDIQAGPSPRAISIALKKEKPLCIEDEALVTLNLIVCSVHGWP